MNSIHRNLEITAQKLRTCTALPEYELWQSLCEYAGESIQILRQVPISRWIVDIFLPDQKLIIDVGGDSMEWAQSHTDEQERELLRLGFRRVVVHNTEIKDSHDQLVKRILKEILV